jgi:NitT/TauT family transport system substrate-binding protein
VSANTGLKFENEKTNWGLVNELMRDEFSTTVALGYFDPARMDSDYKLIETYFKLDAPYDIKTTFTNDMLDRSIKMPK